MHTEPIISENLKALWTRVEQGVATREAYSERHESLINRYREEWASALLLPGSANLEESAIRELAAYFPDRPPEEIRRRCMEALQEFKEEWERTVTAGNGHSIEQFYGQNQSYIYELMWWHTLSCDLSPLSYVVAKHLAAVESLGKALKPRGIIFGRFHTDEDDDRGQHIVRDFGPTFRKLESLGFEQVWEDDWLWGHKAFQRTTKLSPRRGVPAGLE